MRRRYDTVGAFRPAVRPEPEPPPRTGAGHWLRGALTDHLGLKLLALVLTLTVFLVVGSSDEEREIRATVGVRYVLPEGKVLVSDRLDEVRLTIKGPWRRIKRFDERELDQITIDASKRSGEVTITPDMIDLPDGLSVSSIEPRSVRVAFENRIAKQVEVRPVITGRPAHGYAVVQSGERAEPATVVVRGAESVVSAMSQVRTQDIAVDGRSADFEVEATLLPPHGVDLDWAGSVLVRVPIAGRWVGAAEVVALVEGGAVPPSRLVIEPGEVEVELTGSRPAIDRLVAQGVRPTIKLPRGFADGTRAEVAVDGVPSGVQVVVRPAEVRVGLKR
ncbi:MAG TPA: CdaR family protein [Kofleriaceae bacterium]|jgi:YbbR domain-containing protein|nr:CdaR family protein [Kofleriaceae bacterium]